MKYFRLFFIIFIFSLCGCNDNYSSYNTINNKYIDPDNEFYKEITCSCSDAKLLDCDNLLDNNAATYSSLIVKNNKALCDIIIPLNYSYVNSLKLIISNNDFKVCKLELRPDNGLAFIKEYDCVSENNNTYYFDINDNMYALKVHITPSKNTKLYELEINQ